MRPMETQNYKFFQHKQCEFFPCHKTNDPDNFNCLFCYCPLYALGDKCGGAFTYTENGFKDCSKCIFPHKRQNYERIMERYGDIVKIAARSSAGADEGKADENA